MRRILLGLLLLNSFLGISQGSPDSAGKKSLVEETFKSSRVILGQSIENPPNGALAFIISHHFGALNTGFYEFFGLDQASTRLGLEYGFTNFFALGIGRSTYEKTWDGYLKFRILNQRKRGMPLSLGAYSDLSVNTLKETDTTRPDNFNVRLTYCTELIIARKFGEIFSLQLTPVWIHKNLVPTRQDHNNIFALGAGISFDVSEKVSINSEYYYLFPGQHLDDYTNSFSIGCDLKVGGHIFQLFLTNSQGNFEKAFISETKGKWFNGDIYFGFNIHRLFILKTPKPR